MSYGLKKDGIDGEFAVVYRFGEWGLYRFSTDQQGGDWDFQWASKFRWMVRLAIFFICRMERKENRLRKKAPSYHQGCDR